MNDVTTWDIPVSTRIDGTPWPLRVHEVRGDATGPTTAFVAGMWGDKALGVLTLHELIGLLCEAELHGRVLVVPAINTPALEAGTRVSPDHHQLNRRFPGSPTGFLTDQIAHRLVTLLRDECDCAIDVHSGTPSMALGYTYDFGDLDVSTAWGRLPVIVDHTYPGQLCSVLAKDGIRACLPEFHGGPHRSTSVGIAGCLNVLRFRGQLDGALDGPARLPIIRDLQLVLASTHGILDGTMTAADVGATVPVGPLGRVVNPVTGETVEEFVVERDGGLLLMATMTPALVAPGGFAYMVGFPFDERPLPEPGSGADKRGTT